MMNKKSRLDNEISELEKFPNFDEKNFYLSKSDILEYRNLSQNFIPSPNLKRGSFLRISKLDFQMIAEVTYEVKPEVRIGFLFHFLENFFPELERFKHLIQDL